MQLQKSLTFQLENIQAFLERRNYEYFNVTEMQSDDIQDFDFIEVSHIAYDREKTLDNLALLDFQQFLNATACRGGQFAYMIDSDTTGIKLYLGMNKQAKNTGGGG